MPGSLTHIWCVETRTERDAASDCLTLRIRKLGSLNRRFPLFTVEHLVFGRPHRYMKLTIGAWRPKLSGMRPRTASHCAFSKMRRCCRIEMAFGILLHLAGSESRHEVSLVERDTIRGFGHGNEAPLTMSQNGPRRCLVEQYVSRPCTLRYKPTRISMSLVASPPK